MRAMKNETSRLWIGGWVAMALFCGAAGCSDDEVGPTDPTPDASGDAAVDSSTRMDVATDAGGDGRTDGSDGSTSPDSRDATTETTNDRTNIDVRDLDGFDVSDGDAGDDAPIDVPVTPPTGFSITGILGTADATADAWLMGGANPTVQWGAAMGAQNYEITVYEEDGTTVKCAAQTVDGTATSAAFTNCALTEGLQYRASVVATAGTFRTTAMNDKFRFAVGAVVWGQPDGKSHEGSRLGLALPQDVTFTGTKMIVADQSNNYEG